MEDMDQDITCISFSVFFFSNYLIISDLMVVLNITMF